MIKGPELIISEDGSHTLYVANLDEHYHSIHGAIQESKHVYIDAGLKLVGAQLEEINIFEVGFGTGLNALLSYQYALENNKKLLYHTAELYPISMEIAAQLNYTDLLGKDFQEFFLSLHESEWNEKIVLNNYFSLYKHLGNIYEIIPGKKFDIIYFDAFAPEKQESLWSLIIFKTMFELLASGGILLTYCAKGSVRRIMREAGFYVERIPGPPGKRQMMRATKF